MVKVTKELPHSPRCLLFPLRSWYPRDIVQLMMAVDKPLVVPHCLLGYNTYDYNSWQETPEVIAGRSWRAARVTGNQDHPRLLAACAHPLGFAPAKKPRPLPDLQSSTAS